METKINALCLYSYLIKIVSYVKWLFFLYLMYTDIRISFIIIGGSGGLKLRKLYFIAPMSSVGFDSRHGIGCSVVVVTAVFFLSTQC